MLRDFARWARKIGITKDDLIATLDEMNRGLLGDRLGGHLFKKRIGIGNKGKRGGARTILIFMENNIALFIYGYAKNELGNITNKEVEALRVYSKEFLQLTSAQREAKVNSGHLIKF